MASTKYEHVPISDSPKDDNNDTQRSDSKDKVEETRTPVVSFFELFRFAEGIERFLVVLGIAVAWLAGLSMPIMIILFGRFSNALVKYGASQQQQQCLNVTNVTLLNDSAVWLLADHNPNSTSSELAHENTIFGVGLTLIGVTQLALGYLMVMCLNVAAERQVHRIRHLFLQSILKQDISWFNSQSAGDFASRTAEGLTKLQDGIGEKIGMFNFFLATFIFSVINAFAHGWKLTLVMLSVTPLMVVATAILSKIQTSVTEDELKAYSKAGAAAEEVLTAVKTVVAFGGEAKEVDRYDDNLDHATKAGVRRGLLTAVGGSFFFFMIYACYALAFWYGVKLIIEQYGMPDPEYDASTMIIVFFSVLMGAMNMGQSAPYIESFSQAKAAASTLYDIIDRVPPIDSSSEEGLKPKEMSGNVEFDAVDFKYPSRSDVQVLRGLNLEIAKGETVALVGESGCGKSTVIQLLLRFYDPLSGIVRVDGHDIKTLNLGWLRDNIGIVGQEPVLFSTTIAENIMYGLQGSTMDDVIKAAKQANAHDFICKLPKKYETEVGDRGAQLSGGQKQRVAIARALIKNPKILLLDEATSALDSESEAVVQEALDNARMGRTTIIIAHRLSTIRNADKIAVVSNGCVVEHGTHHELMDREGLYYTMVTSQSGGNEDIHSSVDINERLSQKSPHSEIHFAAKTPYYRQRTLSSGSEGISNEEDNKDEKTPTPSFLKLIRLCKPEWHLVALGCIAAFCNGFNIPAYAIVFGDIMSVLAYCDHDKTMQETVFYVFMFLLIGVGTAIFNFLQVFMFTYSGEALTRRLRKQTFATMLKQVELNDINSISPPFFKKHDMSFFDDQKNSVGTLCTNLSSDASNVQGATGSKIGVILQSICTLSVSTIVSLILCWKLALVGMCSIPLVLASGYIQCMIIMGQSVVELKSLDKANKIAVEVISNIRTVASLHTEVSFHKMYMQNLAEPHKKALKNTHARGLVFGFAQSTPFFTYGACMFYGGYLVLHDGMDYGVAFQIAELLILGTMMVGQAFAFAPNANKGAVSASRIFQLLEKQPQIDSSLDYGITLPDNSPGQLEFRLVSFFYPTRKTVSVLRELNLTVEPGKVLALVGSSGCGKSTCVQLLERFYDPTNGCVTMDDTDMTKLNVPWLRSRVGLVSQEPMLFDRSIAENIAYGDNSREVPMSEIIKAATDANIHQFIAALPQGYQTSAGDKGAQLSGGQKQRIAIARALVRNPKILLLDEATSALDTESEKVVQEALERAQKGRTCIVVAHRLSTVRDADHIAVIHQGKVVEKGSHEELMALRGHYYKFYQTQTSH